MTNEPEREYMPKDRLRIDPSALHTCTTFYKVWIQGKEQCFFN